MVISINGLGVFDQISRAAMLDGLLNVHCGAVLRAHVLRSCFFSSVGGDSAAIRQDEGCEQRDALMPSSLQWGITALDAVHEELQEREVLLAFQDGIYVVTLDAVLQDHVYAGSTGQDAGVEPWWDETSSLRCA